MSATFTEFQLATQERVVTPSTNILNEAALRTYELKYMLMGKEYSQIIKGGSELTDFIQFSDNGSFQFYRPNEDLNPTHKETMKRVKVDWRYGESHMVWTEQETVLNSADKKAELKHLTTAYEQAAYTASMNGIEKALWATPIASDMEAAGGKVPYSIMAFIDELGSTYAWPGFSTVETVDPVTEDGWRNQTEKYDPALIYDDAVGVLQAFDRMIKKVSYETPETGSQYFQETHLRNKRILTNLDGSAIYVQALRRQNDRTVSPQDPSYGNPTYMGIPVSYVASLDDANLDQNALVNSGVYQPWQTGQPRYVWCDYEWVFPVFSETKFLTWGKVFNESNQPESYVKYLHSWYNVFCRSRRRLGIISPFAP